jgi:hypothetical protein
MIQEIDETNVIKIRLSKEVNYLIKHLSKTLKIPISQVLRPILEIYKDKNELTNKIDTDDYSKTLYIEATEEFTVEIYQNYADKITNRDIIYIINDVFETVENSEIEKE